MCLFLATSCGSVGDDVEAGGGRSLLEVSIKGIDNRSFDGIEWEETDDCSPPARWSGMLPGSRCTLSVVCVGDKRFISVR